MSIEYIKQLIEVYRKLNDGENYIYETKHFTIFLDQETFILTTYGLSSCDEIITGFVEEVVGEDTLILDLEDAIYAKRYYYEGLLEEVEYLLTIGKWGYKKTCKLQPPTFDQLKTEIKYKLNRLIINYNKCNDSLARREGRAILASLNQCKSLGYDTGLLEQEINQKLKENAEINSIG